MKNSVITRGEEYIILFRRIKEQQVAISIGSFELVISNKQLLALNSRVAAVAAQIEREPERHMQGRCECIETPTPNRDGYCQVCGGDLTGRVTTETVIHRS